MRSEEQKSWKRAKRERCNVTDEERQPRTHVMGGTETQTEQRRAKLIAFHFRHVGLQLNRFAIFRRCDWLQAIFSATTLTPRPQCGFTYVCSMKINQSVQDFQRKADSGGSLILKIAIGWHVKGTTRINVWRNMRKEDASIQGTRMTV